MPRINIRQREHTILDQPTPLKPDDNITPRIADESAGYSAMAKAGANLTDVASYILAAEARSQAGAARSQFNLQMSALKESYKTRSDYEKFEDDFQKGANDIMKALGDKYSVGWKRAEEEIKHDYGVHLIGLRSLALKKRIDHARADTYTTLSDLSQMIATTPDPEIRDILLGEAHRQIDIGVEDGLFYADDAVKMKGQFASKAAMSAYRQDLQASPDKALELLSAGAYTGMTPDDEIKAGNLYDTRQRELERRARVQQREVHNTYAKEAYDRRLSWKKGKSPDGIPFAEWLIQAREQDLISEHTYQMHMNTVERAADRAASGERKMTARDWIEFGKIKADFIKPGSDKDWDDIGQLAGRFPNSRISELVNVVAKQPSATRKALISNNWSYINKRLSEGKASADVWKETNDKWNAQLEVTGDADIPKLARELVKEIPQGGFSPMLEQLRREKEAQRNKPGFFQKIFRFNPSNGKIEGGK